MASKREALNSCGRLKPGFKFRKGGGVYKVKAKRKRARGKRNTTGSLF